MNVAAKLLPLLLLPGLGTGTAGGSRNNNPCGAGEKKVSVDFTKVNCNLRFTDPTCVDPFSKCMWATSKRIGCIKISARTGADSTTIQGYCDYADEKSKKSYREPIDTAEGVTLCIKENGAFSATSDVSGRFVASVDTPGSFTYCSPNSTSLAEVEVGATGPN